MNYAISQKRVEAMEIIDTMPGDLRECVHEFGLPIITVLTKFGVRDPRHIREVVREIWHGARQEGQRSDTLNSIDVLLARGDLTLRGLARFLADNNMAIVRVEPTRAMIDASLEEVSGYNVRCSKEEKHRRRLRAALRAGMKETLANLRLEQ